MTHPIVSREAWLHARKALLDREKALARERDALAAARRALPWVEVAGDYRFESESGEAGLADLFGGKSQLIVSHFMFGPDWEAGCPSCSFWADGYDPMVVHLAARDVAFAAVSRAPLAALLAYRNRMGWALPVGFCAAQRLQPGFRRVPSTRRRSRPARSSTITAKPPCAAARRRG